MPAHPIPHARITPAAVSCPTRRPASHSRRCRGSRFDHGHLEAKAACVQRRIGDAEVGRQATMKYAAAALAQVAGQTGRRVRSFSKKAE